MTKLNALLVLVVSVLTVSCSRKSEFHYGFPAIHPCLSIQDDQGATGLGAKVTVTTIYWYPSLFGQPKSKQYTDEFPVGTDSKVEITLRRHHQITKQELKIEAPGCATVITRVDDSLNWSEFESRPRKIAVTKIKQSESPTRKLLRGTNANETRTYEIPLRGPRTNFSFLSGEFTDNGGDLAFEIKRPASADPDKQDKPVSLLIRPINGQVQQMTDHEVYFSLEGSIAKWGDSDAIQLEAPNSRNYPPLKSAFAYTSSDGRTRALVRLIAIPVREKAGDEPTMEMWIWAKIDRYPDKSEGPTKAVEP